MLVNIGIYLNWLIGIIKSGYLEILTDVGNSFVLIISLGAV